MRHKWGIFDSDFEEKGVEGFQQFCEIVLEAHAKNFHGVSLEVLMWNVPFQTLKRSDY